MSTHAYTHEDDCELDITVVVIFTMVPFAWLTMVEVRRQGERTDKIHLFLYWLIK